MNILSPAPCGVICALCYAYQREKNRCVGCNGEGYKPNHCNNCSIRFCKEKSSPGELCLVCGKYPCRRLRDLEKMYVEKYGESPRRNMELAQTLGKGKYGEEILRIWTCQECGHLLSAHRDSCVICHAKNGNYPEKTVPVE